MKLLLLALVPVIAFAQAEAEYLKVTKIKGASVLITGKAGEAVVTATVTAGIHVQANPASMANLVATQLLFEGNDSFDVGVVQYPEAKVYRLKSSDRDIQTYDGTFEIKVPLKAKSGKAKLGKNEISAKLRYQACNDKTCFFPTTAKLVIPVMVYK